MTDKEFIREVAKTSNINITIKKLKEIFDATEICLKKKMLSEDTKVKVFDLCISSETLPQRIVRNPYLNCNTTIDKRKKIKVKLTYDWKNLEKDSSKILSEEENSSEKGDLNV